MDVLRNLFGNLTAGIIRLAVVVGILAAVYFFAIRPVLDTTENISNQAFQHSDQISNSIQRSIQRNINQTNRQIQQQLRQSGVAAKPPSQRKITRTVHGLTPAQARRLNRCINRVVPNVRALNRCFDRAERAKRRAR
jgi:hypothetical protein